jgi:site-specific recombinase XerD
VADITKLGPWVRRFLQEHLISERNLSRNTQRSYRDTLALLIPFAAREARKKADELTVVDLSEKCVGHFLTEIEEVRRCSTSTRNQRLAAIHSFSRFVAIHSPEHIEWCEQVRTIPFKKCTKRVITYLEKEEMDALLAAPDLRTPQGRRDHLILLFLYNTGARADEVAQLHIADLDLARAPNRGVSSVRVLGKGNKERRCPIWPQTTAELMPAIDGRKPGEHVFLNRYGRPITRFGIHGLVQRYSQRIATRFPSLGGKRVSPHCIRHTTATHLLRAGVDINTIRAWLGHVSLNTTNVYAEIDLEMKATALAHCEVKGTKPPRRWNEDKGIMAFLRGL